MIQEATRHVHDCLDTRSINPLYGEWKYGNDIRAQPTDPLAFDGTMKREPFEIDGYTYFCSYNQRPSGEPGEGSLTIVDEKIKFEIFNHHYSFHLQRYQRRVVIYQRPENSDNYCVV